MIDCFFTAFFQVHLQLSVYKILLTHFFCFFKEIRKLTFKTTLFICAGGSNGYFHILKLIRMRLDGVNLEIEKKYSGH